MNSLLCVCFFKQLSFQRNNVVTESSGLLWCYAV